MSATQETRSLPYVMLADGLAMVPVAHSLQAFADELRRAVSAYQPRAIALELPRPLTPHVEELVKALPEIRLLAWRTPQRRALMIPGDPCDSLIEGVRLAREHGLPWELVDVLEGAATEEYVHLPDHYAVRTLGLARYVETCLDHLPPREVSDRERVMAVRLAEMLGRHERVLFVGGLGHLRNLRTLLQAARETSALPEESEAEVRLLPIPERQLEKILLEIPYVAYLYDVFRDSHGPEEPFPVLEAYQTILQLAAEEYQAEYDETVNLTEWRALLQFARNMGLVRDKLAPGLYELLTAARNCVDGDFGALTLEVAMCYPPNAPPPPNPWLDSDEDQEDIWAEYEAEMNPFAKRPKESLNVYTEFEGERVRLEHAYPFPELTQVEILLRRRKPEDEEVHEWRRGFAFNTLMGSGICSWPPEDEFIERFFRTVRERAFRQISEEHSSAEEFTSSLLDGLDVRETMRHWHDRKLYVRRERIPPGRVGPVVIVWRDFQLNVRELWKSTLYAENQNESDISIYCKPLGEDMVGPGITRTEYHGILSVFPAAQIPDIWYFPPIFRWRMCGRMLLAAGILLSEERYVAYVADQPPDLELRNFARDHGRAIVYLPLSSFSRTLLKRARQCHILSSKEARNWAADYIDGV